LETRISGAGSCERVVHRPDAGDLEQFGSADEVAPVGDPAAVDGAALLPKLLISRGFDLLRIRTAARHVEDAVLVAEPVPGRVLARQEKLGNPPAVELDSRVRPP